MRIKHWIAPVLIVTLGGCDDMLTETPDSFLAPENFYRTAQDADAAVLSIYHAMTVPGPMRVQFRAALENASDEGQVGPLEPNPNVRVVGVMSYDAQSPSVTNAWTWYYQAVTRANLAIERIPGANMPEEGRRALIAEAKFLRALAYFYLVRLYSGVPLVTTTAEQLKAPPRASEDAVYQQIFQDANEASQALPRQWAAGNRGRATAGAALTLLADAYLHRQEWQRAADAARSVIDMGTYSLFPDYLRAFLPASKNGVEHVFSFQANGPASPVMSSYAAIYYPREVGPNRGGGWGMAQPTRWHYESYIPGDYRKDVTYRTDWVNLAGRKYNNLYPHVYKYRPTNIRSHVAGDVNPSIYRYAEVLLIHAEALNELGRSAEAVQHLNMIRERARRGTGGENRAEPADYTGPLGKDAVREAIFQERRWELAHENKRWFDLKRRGEEYFMEQIAAHDPQSTALHPSKMLWPVPQDEVDIGGLVQNPGY